MKTLWFPQIESESAYGSSQALTLVQVIQKFFNCLGFDSIKLSKNPLIISDQTQVELKQIDEIIAYLNMNDDNIPTLVFGMFSEDEAIELSWEEFGLNIFDLPWFETKKAFLYIPVTHIFIKLNRLIETAYQPINKSQSAQQLEYAKCHTIALNIQDAFGHGNRDELQVMSCRKIGSTIQRIYIDYKDKNLPCKNGCSIINQLDNIKSSIPKLKEEACPEIAQRIANLDCSRHKYAPLGYYQEEHDEKPLAFKKIVILEDNVVFRNQLRKDMLDFIKSDNIKIDSESLTEHLFQIEKAADKNAADKNIDEDKKRKREVAKLVDEELKNIQIADGSTINKIELLEICTWTINESFLSWFFEEFGIIIASPEFSMNNCRLYNYCGKNILDELGKESIHPTDILTCFDLDLKLKEKPNIGMAEFMSKIYAGYWVLYGTANEYPLVPRMVITGYRLQDFNSFIVGADAYMMKPYTKEVLNKSIERTLFAKRFIVKWYCPKHVQPSYKDKASFEKASQWLVNWLENKRIHLDVVEKLHNNDILQADLIIVDECVESDYSQSGVRSVIQEKLFTSIEKIKDINPNVSILTILSDDIAPADTVRDFYQKLPLSLKSGKDAIIRKPMWFIAEKHPEPKTSLGGMIENLIAHQDAHDIKYQILVAVSAVLGRFPAQIARMKRTDPADVRFSPLLPFLINSFGLYCSLKDLEEYGDAIKDRLNDEIKKDKKKEKDRWKNVKDEDIEEILNGFLNAITDNSIRRHLNIEKWLRAIVDDSPNKILNQENIHSLTEPLARVFGGSTRYEFSVRGSWYKDQNRIDDILIVVEFCAKSSILAKRFIRETAVDYLKHIAGEDLVLVQEIPIHGYFW